MNSPEWYDEDKLCRVRFVHHDGLGETCWAIKITEGTARLANAPLVRGYGWGDLIEATPDGHAGKVIKKYEGSGWEGVVE